MSSFSTEFDIDLTEMSVVGEVDIDVYYEPADPSVGIMSAGQYPDGWEIIALEIFYNENGDCWQAKNRADIEMAQALMEAFIPEEALRFQSVLEKYVDDQVRDYEPPEPDYCRGDDGRWYAC